MSMMREINKKNKFPTLVKKFRIVLGRKVNACRNKHINVTQITTLEILGKRTRIKLLV